MRTASSTSTHRVFDTMRPCQCHLHANNGVHANSGVKLPAVLHGRPALRTAAFKKQRGHPSKQNKRPGPCPCRASSEDEPKPSNDSKVVKKSDGRISTTLAGLDALLGIQEERKEEEEPKKSQDSEKSEKVTLDVSPDVLRSIAQADLGRKTAQNGSSKGDKDAEKKLSDQMTRIVERAKQMAGQDAEQGKVTEQNLGKDFETLLGMLRPEESVNKEDIRILKEQVFGPNVFWVTGTRTTDDVLDGGVVVRGNLRAPREQVFDTVLKGVKHHFGNKYQVFLVQDPDSEEEDAKGGPRVAFQIIPSIVANPRPTLRWQYAAAAVLFGLTLLSATQLGLLANVSKLPKETVEWLARPENYDPDRTPPGLEGFDPLPFLLSSLPITASVMSTQLAHELGHRVVAFQRKIKLGASLFIPNSQIGTFGAVTQFKSLVKNNADMFDVSFAGPLAAATTSLLLFAVGLAWSSGADIPKESLVPVPTQLFQGSLLLGSIANAVLGESAMSNSNVLIHPVLIGGWCGLVATALNSLPVGSIDGGKMTQASFGQSTLGITSFFTYVGLGLGFLGSSLALPFGLYVLICQRTSEKYVQDKITPATGGRQTALAILVLTSILILLPMLPSGTEQAAVSNGTFL